jgi:hypothetical protein
VKQFRRGATHARLSTPTDNIEELLLQTDMQVAGFASASVLEGLGIFTTIAGIVLLKKYDKETAGWACVGSGLGSLAVGIALMIVVWLVPAATTFRKLI